MLDFEKYIRLAKENDENAMLEIINAFKPLINKYYKDSYHDEDVKSELTLKLIQIVKCDINLDKMRELNNYVLVGYIAKSILHHYMAISNKNRSWKNIGLDFGNEAIVNYSSTNESISEITLSDIVTFNFLKSVLTEKEFDCIYCSVFMGYSSVEIANYLHITRQACNQCKLRAFAKIRKYYEFNGK